MRAIQICSNSVEKIKFSKSKLTYAKDAKRLATPWQVALVRAKHLSKSNLSEGILVDPACGSGIQLAAFGEVLGKDMLGIELDDETAIHASTNIQQIINSSKWDMKSCIIIGDGLKAEACLQRSSLSSKISFLHLDPARPRNSRMHTLDEMSPQLHEVLRAWAPLFSESPALMLDLSPRLIDSQRLEVEGIVDKIWPNIKRTWEWTSRGKGRVDRLSLWLGRASGKTERRYMRILPDNSLDYILIEGNFSSDKIPKISQKKPKIGSWITIVDAALVHSGLASQWFKDHLLQQTIHWVEFEGRRPIFFHKKPINILNKNSRKLIQATGRLCMILDEDLNLNSLNKLIDLALELKMTSLRLRINIEPEKQPLMQRIIDSRIGNQNQHKGFICQGPNNTIFLCEESLLLE